MRCASTATSEYDLPLYQYSPILTNVYQITDMRLGSVGHLPEPPTGAGGGARALRSAGYRDHTGDGLKEAEEEELAR